jgi:hypothetical protein
LAAQVALRTGDFAHAMHLVGEGDEIVAHLGVGDAAFWIAPAASTTKRLDPRAIDGATSRKCLVVDDPDTVTPQAVRAGAKETSLLGGEHGWRSAGSSTHSVRSGRSASQSAPGHQHEAGSLRLRARKPYTRHPPRPV